MPFLTLLQAVRPYKSTGHHPKQPRIAGTTPRVEDHAFFRAPGIIPQRPPLTPRPGRVTGEEGAGEVSGRTTPGHHNHTNPTPLIHHSVLVLCNGRASRALTL